MTLTPEVKSAMSTSNPYCNNAQIVVVPAGKAAQYGTLEAVKNLTFAVEHGSAGNEQAKANGLKCVEVQDQASALMEAASGTADGAIIDSLMAALWSVKAQATKTSLTPSHSTARNTALVSAKARI